jgi:ketosteroid isomerase-like protein
MADSNEDVVRQGYDAFGAGDMERLSSLMTPDVVHSVPGNNPITGDYKGIDEVLGYYGNIFELTGGNFSADLKSVKAEGDNKVISTHTNKAARPDGRTLDSDTNLEFTIENGKITRIDEKPGDQAAEDAFWA